MKCFSSIAAALLLAASMLSCNETQQIITFPEPAREAGITDVLELRCEPLDTVRLFSLAWE